MTDYLDALLHGKNRAKTATGDAADRYRCCIARSFRPRFSLLARSSALNFSYECRLSNPASNLSWESGFEARQLEKLASNRASTVNKLKAAKGNESRLAYCLIALMSITTRYLT